MRKALPKPNDPLLYGPATTPRCLLTINRSQVTAQYIYPYLQRDNNTWRTELHTSVWHTITSWLVNRNHVLVNYTLLLQLCGERNIFTLITKAIKEDTKGAGISLTPQAVGDTELSCPTEGGLDMFVLDFKLHQR